MTRLKLHISSILIITLILSTITLTSPQTQNKVHADTDSVSITITFDPNGGKLSTKSKTVTTGETYGALPTPSKNRSIFQGWYTAPSGGSKISSADTVDLTADTKLYAQWKKTTKVTYTFDPNGGKVKTKQKAYKYNKKFKKLPTPKRSGYEFMGWYTKKRGGKKITAKTKVTTQKINVTMYAKWAPTYFMQTSKKYASKPYGKGKTVRDIGCGPTALSMALYTLGKKNTNPVKACAWSYKNGYLTTDPGRTKDGFFIKYAKKYDVKVTQLNKGDLRKKSKKARKKINKKALSAVKEGNWVIAFMRDSLWANRGHFILWYDVVGKNALIRDPVTTLPKRAKNKYSRLQKEAVRYWVIEVPDNKKLSQ